MSQLGYSPKGGAWRHSDPARTAVFLGDFIDRGPCNGDVIKLVRNMIDAGSARAVMGNHELNAIHYHTRHPETGVPLRCRTEKNTAQHQSFLNEFPPESPATDDVISWMQKLPLFLETSGFRAVHACWDEKQTTALNSLVGAGVLSRAELVRAANPKDRLHRPVETVLKGPEGKLPPGYSIEDKSKHRRTSVRLKWWGCVGKTWTDAAISVPDPGTLPTGEIPPDVAPSVYPADAKPVFFGHYWLTGDPVLQTSNALCLDYSAGIGGPLVTYPFEEGRPLSAERMIFHKG